MAARARTASGSSAGRGGAAGGGAGGGAGSVDGRESLGDEDLMFAVGELGDGEGGEEGAVRCRWATSL